MADMKNLYGFEKLNNQNYSVWAFKMKMLLIKEDLWMTIEGNIPEGIDAREIHKKHEKALSMIALMVENDQVTLIKDSKSGKAAWCILKAYHQQTAMGFKVRIFKRLFRIRLPRGGDMQKHIQTISEMTTDLQDRGVELTDEVIVSVFLASLNEEWDPLVTAIEAWDSARLTVANVKAKLLDEWDRKKNNGECVAESDDVALKVQPKYDFTCYYCQKPGHLKRNCPIYNAVKMNQNKESAKESRYKN
uniref:CSON014982 protein n=1 Tax=Culicoides sonorensis TaxID=179676 RepID=A0A336KVP2_CULSO